MSGSEESYMKDKTVRLITVADWEGQRSEAGGVTG
jgi:hypothetical protein